MFCFVLPFPIKLTRNFLSIPCSNFVPSFNYYINSLQLWLTAFHVVAALKALLQPDESNLLFVNILILFKFAFINKLRVHIPASGSSPHKGLLDPVSSVSGRTFTGPLP